MLKTIRPIMRSPLRRATTGCSAGRARRPSRSRAPARTCGSRPRRTASRTGGTCTWARRRRRRRGRTSGTPGSRTSCARLAEHLVHALYEPVVAARLDRLGQARADDEDVVVRAVDLAALEPGAPDLAELPLDPVAHDGGAGRLRDGETEPRLARLVLGALEAVERQVARRDRAAVPVDGVEVAGAREAMLALHYAERRLRPLARRRFRIKRPARVDIRARKPCFRFLLRTF